MGKKKIEEIESEKPPIEAGELDSHIQSSLETAPPPSESAIEAHAARENEIDTEIEKEKGGKRKYKKRESKGSATSSVSTVTEQMKVRAYRQVGYMLADTLITAGMTFGGEDWKPNLIKDEKSGEILFDEKGNLREAWADLAEEYKWEKMPAWIAVSLATGAYAIPRMFAPSTKARISKFKLWLDAFKLKRQEAKDAKDREKDA